MKIEIIEILLVCLIVVAQVYVFMRTFKQIHLFKRIIPNVNDIAVSRIKVPIADLKTLSPKEILANLSSYKNSDVNTPNYIPVGTFSDDDISELFVEDNLSERDLEKKEINIIEMNATAKSTANPVFEQILFSVNNYLIRNSGAASDFNLIKDIAERNTNACEEDINVSISIPLYMGLMGTMIGIVVGLFNMPDLGATVDTNTKDLLLNEGIALLIGGVKIAMIASFVGLLLTIINSGSIFKEARSHSEVRKNEFYTFVQIELLPVINQGLSSTFESLQRNLLRFNSEFSSNLKGLTGIFDVSRNAIKEQKQLLDALDKAKVTEMTKYNVAVLKQLDVSVAQFEKFNINIGNVNELVDSTQQIVGKTNDLLARTDNFKFLAEGIENKLHQSQMLMNFLSAHFDKLQEHKEFTSNAVADVGFLISETFKELKHHIQNSSENIKQFTIDETDALKQALSESKTNLSNLEHLATLKNDVSLFKNSAATQGEQVKQAIDGVNTNVAKSLVLLEQIEQKSIITTVKNLFNKANKN